MHGSLGFMVYNNLSSPSLSRVVINHKSQASMHYLASFYICEKNLVCMGARENEYTNSVCTESPLS